MANYVTTAADRAPPPPTASRWPMHAAVAVALPASLAAVYFWFAAAVEHDLPVRNWIITQDYAEEYFTRENTPAISPDGRRVALST